MTLEDLLRKLVVESGERLLMIDEGRALHQARCDALDVASAHAVRTANSAVIVPLMGPVYPRGSYGLEGFRSRLASATANPDVGAIILDVDSPGGTYAGTPESAAAVRAAAEVKPVIAVVDSLAASAAYFIVAQASQIVVSPSADVGSIGVLSMHLDYSKYLTDAGITPTVIRSTPFKAEGNPFEPLTDEAKGAIQAEVDAAHDVFVRAVAQGRKTSLAKVKESFGQGRTVSAQRAVDLGMADKVGTMADVLGALRAKAASRRRSAIAFL